MYTYLESTNSTISANIDAYVEGVYIQEFYDAAGKIRNQTYLQAVNCSQLYPNEELINGKLYCPNTTSIKIQGDIFS